MTNVVDVSDKVRKIQMNIDEFTELPPVPHQRFTQGRAKQGKVQKMLSPGVRPEQLEVALVELTQDCVYGTVKYPKGWIGIVNGNTRQHFWKEGLSVNKPKFVYATIYLCDNMDQVKECYNTFDSPNATEQNREKLYGILARIHNYEPVCSKIVKGEFFTGMSLACHWLYPDIFTQVVAIKPEAMMAEADLFIEEIKAFDQMCITPKNWDQSLLCAAFMAYKKYGTNNPKLKQVLLDIDKRSMDTRELARDGVTHICLEWVKGGDKFTHKGTNWDKPKGMKEVVSFALYWIEKAMNDEKLQQLGKGWEKTGDNFFDSYHKKNSNNLFANNVVNIKVA